MITSLNCNRNTENCDFMNHNTVSTYIIICIFFLKKKKKKKAYLPTYPPLLSMGRPTANKDIFKSGLMARFFLAEYDGNFLRRQKTIKSSSSNFTWNRKVRFPVTQYLWYQCILKENHVIQTGTSGL